MYNIALNVKSEDTSRIQASKMLVELEQYKAELRGRPRIKAVEFKDAPQRRRRDAGPKTIRPIQAKGISSESQTVTTPPVAGGESGD